MELGMTSETQAQHLSKLISDRLALVMSSSQVCDVYWRIQRQMLKRLLIDPNAFARVGLRVLELTGTTGEKGVAARVGDELEVAAPSGWW